MPAHIRAAVLKVLGSSAPASAPIKRAPTASTQPSAAQGEKRVYSAEEKKALLKMFEEKGIKMMHLCHQVRHLKQPIEFTRYKVSLNRPCVFLH